MKKLFSALAVIALAGLAGCSDRRADNIPQPMLNDQSRRIDEGYPANDPGVEGAAVGTTETDTTIGSNPNHAAGGTLNTDASTLQSSQAGATRASPGASLD